MPEMRHAVHRNKAALQRGLIRRRALLQRMLQRILNNEATQAQNREKDNERYARTTAPTMLLNLAERLFRRHMLRQAYSLFVTSVAAVVLAGWRNAYASHNVR